MRRGAPSDRAGGLVLIVSPGGTAERGGMGRILTNVTGHWARSGTRPDYRVIDPYGPRSLLLAPFYLAAALGRLPGFLRGEAGLAPAWLVVGAVGLGLLWAAGLQGGALVYERGIGVRRL